MLALGIIPLMGAVGAAVDYSRANSARTAMQAALDATALMLAKNAPNADRPTQVQTRRNLLFPGRCSTARKRTSRKSRATYTQPARATSP